MTELAKFFAEHKCTVIPEFIKPFEVQTISKYMEYRVNQGEYETRKSTTSDEFQPSNLYCYADPLIEVVLENSLNAVQSVVGKELYPTYSYARVYTNNDELVRHIDRPSCEYSVTVNVATIGDPWPIWMESFDGNISSFTLMPGDAIIYKGCEMYHWREPMNKSNTNINVQFMLHYVDKHGPNASYKLDKRPRIGAKFSSRGV